MNSVSSPMRPCVRARSASCAGSFAAKGLLPALRLPRRAHPDGLVEPGGAAVGPVYGELGRAQARRPERLEEREQEGATVPAAAGTRRHRELGDVAHVAFPALAEPGAG